MAKPQTHCIFSPISKDKFAIRALTKSNGTSISILAIFHVLSPILT